MPIIFSYGTLQQTEVQLSTFGRRLRGQKDELPGYELTTFTGGGTQYANVIPRGRRGSLVRGTAFEITAAELAAADEYEKGAAYERAEVTLASGRRGWVYAHGGLAPGTE